MKILRLRLTNLNSLSGENTVDFTQSPLAHTGLFAITGPTGAGKTTLLDAITLGLYGRVARYGKDPSPDAVMSRHTGECSAEIEFSCASGHYRSVWQLQRARKKPDGKLQAPKRRVIALPAETIVAESIKDADAKILELTGLDYDRFLRSVLLAQGDFAAFLKAGPKERTELLQEVTGTEIYRDISAQAFRFCAEAEQAHATLLREHQAIPVLDLETRARHEATLTAQTTRLAELTTLQHRLSHRVSAARRWIEIENDTRRLASEQATYDQTRTAATTPLARLASHEKAAPFISDLATLDRLSSENEKDKFLLHELSTSLPALELQLTNALSAAEQAKSALGNEMARQADLNLVWTEITELDQTLATTRETLRQLSTHHENLEKNLRDLTTTLTNDEASLKKISRDYTTEQDWLAVHANDTRLPDQLPAIQAALARWDSAEKTSAVIHRTLGSQRQEIGQLEERTRALEGKLSPLQETLTTSSASVEGAQRDLASASEQLSITELEARRDQARITSQALEKLIADAVRLRAHEQTLATLQRETNETDSALLAASDATKQLQQRHDDLATALEARVTALSFAEKVQSLESHRAGLSPHAPCPLCGALDHPYISTATSHTKDLEIARRAASDADANLQKIRAQLNVASQQHAALLATQKRFSVDLAKRSTENVALRSEWNTAATPHTLANKFTDESALSESFTQARAKESRHSAQLTGARAAEQRLHTAREAQRLAQTAFDRAQAEATKQNALIAQAHSQLAKLESSVATHIQAVATEASAYATLVGEFAQPPADLTAAMALHTALKLRATGFTKHQTDTRMLQMRLDAQTTLSADRKRQHIDLQNSVSTSLEKVKAAQTNADRQLTLRREKFGDRTVADARREVEILLTRSRTVVDTTRITSETLRQRHTATTQENARLTKVITERTTEHSALADRLLATAPGVGFANLLALRAALLPQPEADQLIHQRQQLDEQRVRLATRHSTLAQQRTALPATAAEDAVKFAELEVEHTQRENERGTVQGELGELRATLKNDDTQRARQSAFAGQIDAAHREFVRWDKLRVLIGSADGSLFARYAQGLTLDRLAVLANRHLSQLNPRYSLRRAANGEAGDLELEIVDHYQADAVRPMRSLSGGESFLASLALALGLSELASGRTRIDSLFIDEGFGTLDADTLETAMSALENLQADGKTIGVISHVPAMQERIPTQIKVEKKSAGHSRVTIVA